MAAAPISVSALRDELPRSHQCWLCRASNAATVGFRGPGIWHRLRHFLLWVLLLSTSEQSRARKSRGAALDGSHHGALGGGFRRHDLRPDAEAVLHHAVCSGRRRSRLFPRNYSLPEKLVSLDCSCTGCGMVYDRQSDRWGNRRPDFRGVAGLVTIWIGGLAMDVRTGGSACCFAGRDRSTYPEG